MRATVKRGKTVTAVQMQQALQAWNRRMPECGRIDSYLDYARAPRKLTIAELRVCGGGYRMLDWDVATNEKALLIVGFRMVIDKRHTKLDVDILGIVGLHSLARWFQRTGDRSEHHLLEDLKQIGTHFGDVLPMTKEPQHRWHLNASKGRWVGQVARYLEKPMLVVSSYLPGNEGRIDR
jgi:hypothetical protein